MPHLSLREYDATVYSEFETYLRTMGFAYVDCGSYRTAFRRKDIIVKIPRNNGGFYDNIVEAYAYYKYRKGANTHGYVFAPCRLLLNGCLMMVYVERLSYDKMPVWTHHIDAIQCGRYKDRIVAYDSGCDVSHALRADASEWAQVEVPSY